jgi:hypothetical protein
MKEQNLSLKHIFTFIMDREKVFEVFKDKDHLERGNVTEEWKCVLKIHGLDLPYEDIKRIEHQLQQVLAEEVAKYDQSKNWIPPKEELIDKKGVTISLVGLDLPYEDIKRIEHQLQQVLAEEVAKYGRSLQNVRMCTSEPSGLVVRTPYPIGQLASIPTPPQGQSVTAAYYFREDTVKVQIFNARDIDPGATPLHVYIQLATPRRSGWFDPFSGWAKEIYGWINCAPGNPQWILRTDGYNSYSRWHNVGDAYAPGWSLVFRKPKEFGRWYNMYWLESSVLQEAFGGKAVRFLWWDD